MDSNRAWKTLDSFVSVCGAKEFDISRNKHIQKYRDDANFCKMPITGRSNVNCDTGNLKDL